MSERKPSLILQDILKCIEHTTQYTLHLSFDEFSGDFMIIEACLYNIQVIGEAASHLEADVKAAEPRIPWPLIKGMRNRLIHEYFGTDLPLVWNVIKNDLPSLTNILQELQQKLICQGR